MLQMQKETEIVYDDTDLLIIGAGNAGCFAAIEAKRLDPKIDVLLMEKANIERSGCLAAGMDAINTYIKKGRTVEDYVRWSRSQAGGLLREDMAIKIGKNLNHPIEEWEKWGLPIKHDSETDDYITRGKWDITVRGESMKPILAEQVRKSGCRILNRVTATNYLIHDGKITGAFGFGVRDGKMYVIRAKAVCIATGGASGLYKTYNTDGEESHHQLWYSPFNTGAGYALGIRAGAEMTSFEMRWCATRTKDFNGPIDTISVGYGTPMINAYGEKILQTRYAEYGGETAPRYIRASAPMEEWREGRGPCYMDTTHMSEDEIRDMKMDYLNERPAYVLYLASKGQDLTKEPIEIYGNDPYIVGGHTASGYWINSENWQTTLEGLFACGDVAGGVPNKFVGGCAAEGILVAHGALEYIEKNNQLEELDVKQIEKEKERIYAPYCRNIDEILRIENDEMEERMQRIMDEYAGGVHQFFRMNEHQLLHAQKEIRQLKEQEKYLYCDNFHDLMNIHETIDRLDVAEVLIEHLLYRRETRWPAWQTRTDFPDKDETFNCFVNSVRNPETGEIKVFKRPYEQLVSEGGI